MNHFYFIKISLLWIALLFITAKNAFAQLTVFPWSEDFGSPTCALPPGFVNSGTDPWDFQETGETYMEGGDHTTGSSCFASMDDSGTNGADDTCVLVTPAFDLTSLSGPRCGFWWQNSNSSSSQPAPTGPRSWSNLEVDISTDSGSTWINNVFTIIDSQQIGWAYADFSLSPYISPKTMIRFRGIETQSLYSDLALDDISVFEPAVLDAGVAEVEGLESICPGSVPVVAKIVNTGLTNITSVTVNWSVNGMPQTPFYYTGTLAYLETDTMLLGSFTAAAGISYDISVWTSGPNSGVDGNMANDTLSFMNILTGLAGGYTIGASGDFATITAAVNELNNRGVCSAVTFNVDTGTYTGRISLGEIPGTNPSNTITFHGNGATITDHTTTSDRYIVLLNGTDHLTLDSFNITGSGTTYGYGILLTNEANYNTIDACTIDLTAVTSNTSSNSAGIVASGSLTSNATAGNNANFCNFINNTILGGSSGLYYGIRLNGNSGGLGCVGNTIADNSIRDIYAYNIYLDEADSNRLSRNDISRASKANVSDFYGIYLSGGLNNVIERNRIHNTHDQAGSLTGDAYGIYFSRADAPVGKPNMVFNNLIYNMNGNGDVYGFYNSGSDGAHFLYNTISLDDPAATAGATRGIYQTTTASDVLIANNIISISRGGTGDKHGLYFNTRASSIVCDNNIIYVSSAGTGPQFTGRWDGTDYASFAFWQTANSGAFDQSGDGADPRFAAASSGDLTPSTLSGNDIGLPIAGITADFFGTSRNPLTPDPGAIEFHSVQPNDSCLNAIVVTGGSVSGNTVNATADNEVTCVVGNDTSGGLWYKYTASGGYVTASLCTSSFDTRIRVFTGSCGNLVCETGNEDSCGVRSVAGWCSSGAVDYYILVHGNGEAGEFELELNETPVGIPTINALTDTVFCAGDSAVLEASEAAAYRWSDAAATASRSLTLYGSDTVTVTTTDTNGCERTSLPQITVENPLPEVSLGEDTTICHDEMITLDAGPDRSYSWSTGAFTPTFIYNGNGGDTVISVTVTDTNGCMASDEISIRVDICPGVEEQAGRPLFQLYPNPNNGRFTIRFHSDSHEQLFLNIFDLKGRAVFSEQLFTPHEVVQVNAANLPEGIYVLEIRDENSLRQEKLIIR